MSEFFLRMLFLISFSLGSLQALGAEKGVSEGKEPKDDWEYVQALNEIGEEASELGDGFKSCFHLQADGSGTYSIIKSDDGREPLITLAFNHNQNPCVSEDDFIRFFLNLENLFRQKHLSISVVTALLEELMSSTFLIPQSYFLVLLGYPSHTTIYLMGPDPSPEAEFSLKRIESVKNFMEAIGQINGNQLPQNLLDASWLHLIYQKLGVDYPLLDKP